MTVPRVLIDGGAGLNIIFAETLQKIGLNYMDQLKPTDIPFYGIVPGKAAMPLGQITLPVTFGTQSNYRTEFITFEVAGFQSSYHAIFGRPALAKFMAIPHYPYLLLKMPGPHGVLSLRGNLKRSFDCDAESVQIAAQLQAAFEAQEIAQLAKTLTPEELDIPTKKLGIIAPPKQPDVMNIDLNTGDPSKTATISAHLPRE